MRKFAILGWMVVNCAIAFMSGCQTKSTPVSGQTSATTDTSASDASDKPQKDKNPKLESHVGSGPVIELEPDATASSVQKSSKTSASSSTAEKTGTSSPSAVVESFDPSANDAAAKVVSGSEIVLGAPEQIAKVGVTGAAEKPEVDRTKPSFGNVATEAERNQQIAEDWPKPQAVIYVSGQQMGYIEPCGCTGLESQKGGLIRRDTLLTSLRNRGWDVIPIDVGNQNREKRATGPQPQLKFEATASALQLMDYKAVALGVQDLELSSVDLIQVAGDGNGANRPFICANVTVLLPEFFPPFKIVEAGGRKIGITAVVGSKHKDKVVKDKNNTDITFSDPVEALKTVVPELQSQGCDFIVLLAHASMEESAELGKAIEGIDLVVTSGGYGEPTLLPEPIEGSKAVVVQVGTKGMYGGIVGLFNDPNNPIRYQKIAISSQFKDSERMLKLFTWYQDQLKDAGFKGLGLTAALHPTGRQFVGSETCGECHTQAYEVWKDSPHFKATDDIIAANNDRGGIARHYDPECVSCHVTGWEPQGFRPFQTGYEGLEQSRHLLGSGCENCHGPGSAHVAAENGDEKVTPEQLKELQQEMVLPLAKAEAKCMDCHDLDNSPDFHAPGAFEKYWDRVKHYGKN